MLLHAAGGILIVAGVAGVVAYVAGVIEVLGEADRSWIFWGLIFLLGGILLIQGGIGLLFWARERRRNPGS